MTTKAREQPEREFGGTPESVELAVATPLLQASERMLEAAESMDDAFERPKLNTKNQVERKSITLKEGKLDTDTPSFEGYASTFGSTDLQGDIVVQGAFKKTIQDNRGIFPLLSQHDISKEVGVVHAREDERGLFVEGKFYTDDDGELLDVARDEYYKMKRRQEFGRPLQMSIGYRALNPKFRDGKRYLEQIALAECSLVTFPANTEAVTTSVKATLEGLAEKDFQGEFAESERVMTAMASIRAAVWTLEDILDRAFFVEGETERDIILSQLDTDLGDFHSAVLGAMRQFHGVDSKAARDTEHPNQEPREHSEDGAAKEAPASEPDPYTVALAQMTKAIEKPSLTDEVRKHAQLVRQQAKEQLHA